MNITVKEKLISFPGLTTLLVQGEIYPVIIRFVFNTEDEHTSLGSITDWKIYYHSEGGEIFYDTLQKETSQTDNTWTLCWNVSANATEIKGNLTIGIVGTSESMKWKSLPCNVKVAYGITDITADLTQELDI